MIYAVNYLIGSGLEYILLVRKHGIVETAHSYETYIFFNNLDCILTINNIKASSLPFK